MWRKEDGLVEWQELRLQAGGRQGQGLQSKGQQRLQRKGQEGSCNPSSPCWTAGQPQLSEKTLLAIVRGGKGWNWCDSRAHRQ